MQVLKTKLSRPRVMSDSIMQRPQLLRQMVEYCQSSLIFIHAAAGYGKTTLMYQLSEALKINNKRVSWLTLDHDDNDPIRLYQYLYLALLGLEHFQPIPHGHIHKQQIIELTQLASELEADNVFFIDELEVLDNPECLNMLWWLYQYLPENCHLVVSSRIKPNWNLSKEYLLGRLKLVTETNLSIKTEENTALIQFLRQQNIDHVGLTPELVEELIHKTEGWLTGIQLTNLYLKNYHDAATVIQSLNGEHNQIVEYLSEQVFLQLSEDMQDFLLKISVLRKINLSNIQEVSQNLESITYLELMTRKGLFLQALNEQHSWYRIHNLFREFLENRFKINNIEQYRKAHLHAAHWCKQQQYYLEAIYHAELAGEQTLIVELLSEVCRELILEGRLYTLLEQVKLLPDELLLQKASLLYDITWSLIMTHQHLLANHYLQLWLKVDQENQEIKDYQLALAPMIAFMEDDIQQAHQLAQKSLLQLSSDSYFVRAPLIGIGTLYYIRLGKISEARKILIQTRVAYLQGQNTLGLIIVDCIEALSDYLEGNVEKALNRLDYIGKSDVYLKLSSTEFLKPIVNMITSSVKANIYYEINEIDLAEKSLKSFNNGEELIVSDLAIIGHEVLLRLAHITKDVQVEQLCLMQAQICSNAWSIPRLNNTIQIIYDQYQWFENSKKLQSLAIADLEQLCKQHLQKTLNISNIVMGDDLILYRQLIFTDREKVALEFLPFELNRISAYPLRQARVLLLLSLAEYRLGQLDFALKWFEKALVLLEPIKAIRIVLDEHPLLFQLLADYIKVDAHNKKKKRPSIFEFAELLASKTTFVFQNIISEDAINERDIDLLSKRELQILKKVSEGCTDHELADRVYLSVNTVKWHLRNIYNKLGVRSRLEAVTEAKKQGLIH